MTRQEKIRNFSIIAHIDHGKSTLADRILEATRSVSSREMEQQLLDNMDIERERGITIKARAVKLNYEAKDGETYEFNLIDTPGHVDFNYEVSRSLGACEGALLVVDATQGVEAQTLANTYLALENNLEIVPVINKIDLPSADIEGVRREIEEVIGIPAEDCPAVSAKTGLNIGDVLEKIVSDIPAPRGDETAPLKALIFDSYYDSYRGVVVYVRVKDGSVRSGSKIKMMNTGAQFDVVEVGVMSAFGLVPAAELSAGEVGYITASIKSVADTRVGDTVTEAERQTAEPFPGFKPALPMVFAGIYPADSAKYPDLRDALEKLRLNDAALTFEPETSAALGFGFRCGFLGLLHMEIIAERLEREFGLDLVTTAPSVIYKVTYKQRGSKIYRQSGELSPGGRNRACGGAGREGETLSRRRNMWAASWSFVKERRGIFVDMKYLDKTRVELHYDPAAGVRSSTISLMRSRAAARAMLLWTMSWSDTARVRLVKLDILLNMEVVDALSFIVHADKAYARGRKIVEALKENIPRQLFEVPIQAAIGGRVIARETVKAMRKDVLAKCYGGDITRKKKLLEKQKEGKKRMRRLGSVEVPPETFMAVLKLDDE